jgi:HEAT repeat protein
MIQFRITMRTQVQRWLVFIGFIIALLAPARSGQASTQADIGKLVAEAATYEPGQSREAFRRLEELVGNPSAGVRRRLEEGLVRLLAPASTFEARRFACKQLGIIGSNRALPALAELLKSEETAGIACLALTTYPPGKADEVLRAALPEAPVAARIQIINTLGDRRDAKAVKVLAQAAGDADLDVARAAIAALGKEGSEAGWQAIESVSKDANPALQTTLTEATVRCADALARLGDQATATAIYEGLLPPSQPGYVRRAALDALLRLDEAQAQQRTLEVLHGSDSTLVPVAIANVRALVSSNASEVFAAELPRLQPQEQVWMIDSLAARGDAPACAAIGNSLASTDAGVRRAAIDTLGRIGDTWCVGLFASALDRPPDAEERRALESALIDLHGGAQTDNAIVAALKKASGDTRASLISALARRQGPKANPLLLAEAAQSDPTVAKAALRALSKTAGGREVTPLLERLTRTSDAGVRSEAEGATAQAIARMDEPGRGSAQVRQALGWAQSVESRIALLGLLPGCGDAAALAALKSASNSSESRIRDAAVRALADWPDVSAWDALAGIYRQPATEAVRGLALRGLVRLAGEENAHPSAKLVQRYRQLLAGAHDDADFRLILGALGGDAQPEALALALPLLDNAGVRAEAEIAVKKIAEAIKARNPKAAQDALSRLKAKP